MSRENPFQEIAERLSKIEDSLLDIKHVFTPKEILKDIGGVSLAVDETNLSTHTIYRLVCERKIPHSKKGGRLYFSRSALKKWIEEGQRTK